MGGTIIGTGIGIPFKRFNTNNEMTYAVQTINLVSEVEYDLTTTITSLHEIYNVLPDYEGEDAEIKVTWAIAGGVWHVYLWSSDSLTGVKVKIIYK